MTHYDLKLFTCIYLVALNKLERIFGSNAAGTNGKG